jgi:hypothetical protein
MENQSNFPPNSSFSKILPGLQLGIDSTSLGTYKTCAKKYFYSVIMGWQAKGTSVHLEFGIHLHKARERYDHLRSRGEDHDYAMDHVLHGLLVDTWDKELKRPWLSDHPSKNRASLIRTVVWYLDQLGDNDPIETVQMANGKPAVELSFRFDSGIKSEATGESVLLCGHLDRLGVFNGDHYIIDIKTTTSMLTKFWFDGFSPDNQFSLYTLASDVAFGLPVKGLIVDGIQVGATFARFQRAPIPRTKSQTEEWYGDLQFWYRQMEYSAYKGHWPMNDKSCGMYGGCEFREVCSRPAAARDQWLRLNYKRRIWDPLISRGDI